MKCTWRLPEKRLWQLTREFISSYQTKFPKACECLQKDKEVLFTFYDFPAQHWSHLRTTNPIESTLKDGQLNRLSAWDNSVLAFSMSGLPENRFSKTAVSSSAKFSSR
jgi:hypothetical protein